MGGILTGHLGFFPVFLRRSGVTEGFCRPSEVGFDIRKEQIGKVT